MISRTWQCMFCRWNLSVMGWLHVSLCSSLILCSSVFYSLYFISIFVSPPFFHLCFPHLALHCLIFSLPLQTLLEAAYFTVKPPERVARKSKVLTTVQKYIHFLIFEKLDAPGANGTWCDKICWDGYWCLDAGRVDVAVMLCMRGVLSVCLPVCLPVCLSVITFTTVFHHIYWYDISRYSDMHVQLDAHTNR